MAYLKIISQEWKDLSVEEKTIYEDQATIEREKYWQLLADSIYLYILYQYIPLNILNLISIIIGTKNGIKLLSRIQMLRF